MEQTVIQNLTGLNEYALADQFNSKHTFFIPDYHSHHGVQPGGDCVWASLTVMHFIRLNKVKCAATLKTFTFEKDDLVGVHAAVQIRRPKKPDMILDTANTYVGLRAQLVIEEQYFKNKNHKIIDTITKQQYNKYYDKYYKLQNGKIDAFILGNELLKNELKASQTAFLTSTLNMHTFT